MSVMKARRRTQTERREEAETRLLQAAIALLAERGYDGFTLAEVGEAAGYSRGLPAHYFGRKEDLLAAAAQFVVDAYAVTVTQIPETRAGLPRIATSIRHHARAVAGGGSRALGMLIAEAGIRPGIRDVIARLNEQGTARLRHELQAGIAAGTVRPGIDVDTQARTIFAFLRGQMSFANADPQFDPGLLSEAFIGLLEAGLAPVGDDSRNGPATT